MKREAEELLRSSRSIVRVQQLQNVGKVRRLKSTIYLFYQLQSHLLSILKHTQFNLFTQKLKVCQRKQLRASTKKHEDYTFLAELTSSKKKSKQSKIDSSLIEASILKQLVQFKQFKNWLHAEEKRGRQYQKIQIISLVS